MRSLTKLKLINWHYFQNETIIFDGSTLITGDNGTGKSTLIDALQVVIVGNLRKVKFNSSAIEDRTTRDLKSYLRGKTGAEGEEKYLRNHSFTSFIVLEITHSLSDEKFLPGVVFDYDADTGEVEHVFFKIDRQPLDDTLFFREPDITYGRREFFRNLKKSGIKYRQYKNDLRSYIYDLRQLFGGIKESFFPLFQKGISFSPITDLRRFVYDYILEERKIDVESMRDYFEKYRQVEEMIEETKKEITELRSIEKKYGEVERIRRQIEISRYMVMRGSFEDKRSQIEEKKETRCQKLENIKKLEAQIQHSQKKKESLKKKIAELQQEIENNNIRIRREKIKMELEQLEEKLQSLRRTETNIRNNIRTEVKEWQELAEALRYAEAPFEHVSLLRDGAHCWEDAANGDALRLPMDTESLANTWKNAHVWLDDNRGKWQRELAEVKEKIRELRESINELEKNQVLGSGHPTMKLKRILEENLPEGIDGRVPVHVFCEAIEIKDPAWRNAIEGYLHTQKFDLLVPPASFDEALSLYERYKFTHNIERVGLVNTGRLLEKVRHPFKNSLAEEVTAEVDYIEAYAHWLMGGIIKCSSERELKKYSRSITASCMLYQNHTARQIPRERYEVPYIGREAVRFQLKRKKEELRQAEEGKKALQNLLELTSTAAGLMRDREDRYGDWLARFEEVKEVGSVEKKIISLRRELLQMNDSELKLLEKEKKETEEARDDVEERVALLREKVSKERTNLEYMDNAISASRREAVEMEEEFDGFLADFSPEDAEECHKKWRREVAKKSPSELVRNYCINIEGLKTRHGKQREELVEMRTDFCRRYHFSGDAKAEDNTEFTSRLEKLEKSHLEDYNEKATKAREQAEKAFQEHFVASLRESIELAREEIKELNMALKDMRFGTDSYYFSLREKADMKHYYDMIMDPDLQRGESLFSDSFARRHSEAREHFFREITCSEDDFQEKMQELTDYRSYLDFEIIITDENNNKNHFSKVARDKSGGETQVPFYVAILASFYQAYRMYRERDTLRLVVFDEAFNRMDADRIEEAVKFICKLGFQAIIVAPTGRIQLIVPHVNTNLIVMKDGFTSFVERVSRKEIEKWH